MKKILTTRKITGPGLICGCLTAPAMKKRTTCLPGYELPVSGMPVLVKAGKRMGELVIQARYISGTLYYFLLADAGGKMVTIIQLYDTKPCIIRGLSNGNYRFSIYRNRKEISAGEINAP